MKDVFLKKRAEVDEICKKSHMDMPYQREMDTIMGMIISGASQQSDGIPFFKSLD
jgi:Ase1/PRC1/MAP65 family protein